MIVYKITNLLNKKIYVGQTQRTFEERISEHKCGSLYIDHVIKKYGWENFKAEVIEECWTLEELNEREIFWIAKLNSKFPNGYNFTDGGYQGLKGYTWSKESRAKMSSVSKIREAKRNPVEKSQTAKNGWASKTHEERLRITEPARKAAALISPEERSNIRKKALSNMTLQERQHMTENARKALANISSEKRKISAKKCWETRRAKKRLIITVVELLRKILDNK